MAAYLTELAVQVMTGKKLRPAMRAALTQLTWHMNHETGECFVSDATLAKELGYSRQEMWEARQDLRHIGLLDWDEQTEKKKKSGKSNHYRFPFAQRVVENGKVRWRLADVSGEADKGCQLELTGVSGEADTNHGINQGVNPGTSTSKAPAVAQAEAEEPSFDSVDNSIDDEDTSPEEEIFASSDEISADEDEDQWERPLPSDCISRQGIVPIPASMPDKVIAFPGSSKADDEPPAAEEEMPEDDPFVGMRPPRGVYSLRDVLLSTHEVSTNIRLPSGALATYSKSVVLEYLQAQRDREEPFSPRWERLMRWIDQIEMAA